MSLPPEIGDGNGGTFDTATAKQRDLLVALHVKVDQLIGIVTDHESRLRSITSHIDRGDGADGARSRFSSSRIAFFALAISLISAATPIVEVFVIH